MEYCDAKAALDWQISLGVDEAILDAPVDRYALPEAPAKKKPDPAVATGVVAPVQVDAVGIANAAAAAAGDLATLKAALSAFEHCELKKGARSLVFSDGNPIARVMIIGEAPGRDEDVEGRPFVGRAGQLLDKMFDAIQMARTATEVEKAIYITNVLPWRPPQNRDPQPDEVAMLLPFLRRHVELVAPDLIVAMGNHACKALLGRQGITRLRGNWTEAMGRPVLPMFHPAYLLRNPAAKREAWADLLSLQARVRSIP